MGRMNESMFMVAICQEFGWTYEEYTRQPDFFIELIREKMVRDDAERRRQSKSNKK